MTTAAHKVQIHCPAGVLAHRLEAPTGLVIYCCKDAQSTAMRQRTGLRKNDPSMTRLQKTDNPLQLFTEVQKPVE